MPSSNHDSPLESIPSPPMAASAFKAQKGRYSLADGTPLARSEITLPYRRSAPSAASLYASTLSPPGSRSQSPIGRPVSRISGSVFNGFASNAQALVDGVGDSPGDPLNLILKAFVPHVAVYTSEDTDLLLREKGFELGLWEILRPFGDRVAGKVIIRDSNGLSRTYEDYSVHFVRYGEGIEHPESMNSNIKSPAQSEKASGASGKDPVSQQNRRRGGNEADVEAIVERHLTYAEESFGISPHLMDPKQGLDTETPSPYYSLYLRRLLSGLPLVPHETFAHPVACVIAISSRNPSPIETLRRLYNDTSAGERRLPSWVDSEYLRYYVLVHDEEKDDITKSMSLFEQMKRNLGLHCHLLRIRGTQSAATDDDSIPLPTSEWMSAAEELANLQRHDSQEDFEDPTRYIYESDATAIRTFIREMVTQSIIPTMERHVSVWNDQVASKRKGVTGRIMGLTKRWGFGTTSKSSSGGTGSSNYDSLGFYRQDTPEAIMRKLADYCFMLRDWKLAYSTYDILRSDFHGDKAWKYHAAANEMSALSLLIMPQTLSSKTRTETVDSMFDAAFYSYLTRCSAPYGALRCLTLGLELLRLRGGSSVDDAAKWGTRLLESRIAGPIGDALIKERLAVCYASKKGMGNFAWGARRRKSAMWSALSAETWLTQAKYIQAQRCLNEARKMYGDLPNDQGIDSFAEASAFMLEIGRQLNQHLESNDRGDDFSDNEGSEPVDEESEVMNERGRRISTLGLPGATAATLEAAPLRSQTTDEDDDVDSGKPNDDFG
ncbi:cis-golgi transport protein particle complex subunit [Apiospora saccharicola]|uniref:Cis-golgi transport protein particle complex subunit n=1 Tax=Apiospora saccharicola TaxID=335842 RepID=A0ABR1UKS8_9PEZI